MPNSRMSVPTLSLLLRPELSLRGEHGLPVASATEEVNSTLELKRVFAPTNRDIEQPQPDYEAVSPHKVLAAVRQSSASWGFVTLPVFLGDVLSMTLTALLAYLIAAMLMHVSAHQFLIATLALFVPLIAGNLLIGLYPGVALNPVVEFRQLSCVTTIAFLSTASVACLSSLNAGWYPALCGAWLAQCVFGPIMRSGVRAFCRGKRWWGYPVMVFGAGKAASAVVFNLLKHPEYGLRPVIVLDPATELQSVLGLPVVGGPRLATAVAKRLRIKHAIVALPDWSSEQVTHVLKRYASGIRHVMITSAISPFAPGLPILWRDTRDLAGIAGVEVRNRLLSPGPTVLKRSLDILITLLAGISLLPFMCVVAVLVKVSDPGPLFYGSVRIGCKGLRFNAWKFRTMVCNGEEVLREYLQAHEECREEWERDHKLKNDPRVTAIGQFLRKTSIDELPQLWNVLAGEMSLVGPRPILEREIEQYGRCYSIYKSVRPGISGLWQVSGRNDTDYEQRLHYVEYYIRNWSPWLDIHILARTIATLVTGRGAY
jgi:Undecaprenyl-phosphate galactose phosphotransferase WbaP